MLEMSSRQAEMSSRLSLSTELARGRDRRAEAALRSSWGISAFITARRERLNTSVIICKANKNNKYNMPGLINNFWNSLSMMSFLRATIMSDKR